MATLNERMKRVTPMSNHTDVESYRYGYHHGATDQHKIEVKKANRLVSVLLDKLVVEDKDMWLQMFSDAMDEMI